MVHLTREQAQVLAARALRTAGASAAMSASTAHAVVLADMQGIGSHGLSRIPQYASQLRMGRVDGKAVPTVLTGAAASALVDAGEGLAFPACEFAVAEAVERARRFGVGFVGVTRSHHSGVLINHLAPLREQGLVGLAFANAPAAMPAAGGRHPVFGTNPIAALFPRRDAPPLEIDLALSEVARGKLMLAKQHGERIPLGWALDPEGQPTTDPGLGMDGSMLPFGSSTSAKGALLALMVELLVTTLTGAQFSFEASSFFVEEGNRPRLGQAFIVFDPQATAGRDSYLDRIETVIAEMLQDDGVRLPGERRQRSAERARQHGFEIADELHATLVSLARLLPKNVPSPERDSS
jgi:(2R)-3-sulfolactate dehydrogenase (NADP+)